MVTFRIILIAVLLAVALVAALAELWLTVIPALGFALIALVAPHRQPARK